MRKGLLAMCCLLIGFASSPAFAQTPPAPKTVGIRIVDAPTSRKDDPRARQYIVDHLAPGTTITRRVEISNDTASPQAVQLYVAAATVGNGDFQFGEGRAANDLTSWTTVDPPVVNPKAGARVLATVTIAVPGNASPGEQYGVVWAELAPALGGGVTTVNRVGVRIYLSIGPGGEPPSDFAITAFEARRSADGSPVLAATVHNTGGRAVDLSGELQLANGPGGLSAGPFSAKLGTTLGIGQTEPVTVGLDPAIPRGPWDAHLVLRSGTTQRDATARITFPAASATSAAPVITKTSSGGSGPLPIILGAIVVLAVAGAGSLIVRRHRHGAGAAVAP